LAEQQRCIDLISVLQKQYHLEKSMANEGVTDRYFDLPGNIVRFLVPYEIRTPAKSIEIQSSTFMDVVSEILVKALHFGTF
jgi:hypothetical protein